MSLVGAVRDDKRQPPRGIKHTGKDEEGLYTYHAPAYLEWASNPHDANYEQKKSWYAIDGRPSVLLNRKLWQSLVRDNPWLVWYDDRISPLNANFYLSELGHSFDLSSLATPLLYVSPLPNSTRTGVVTTEIAAHADLGGDAIHVVVDGNGYNIVHLFRVPRDTHQSHQLYTALHIDPLTLPHDTENYEFSMDVESWDRKIQNNPVLFQHHVQKFIVQPEQAIILPAGYLHLFIKVHAHMHACLM